MPPTKSGVTQEGLDAEKLEEVKYSSYAELRSWCRELGLPGVGKAEVLRERVLEALQQQQQQTKDAKAASRIPLNEPTSPNKEEPKSPKSGVQRRHRKLSSLQQDAKGAAEAVEGEAEDIAHVVKNAAARGAEDLKEAWDAAKAANYTSNVWSRLKEGMAGWVPSGASWRALLLVFLLGALAGAGLTMLAHPHAWHDVRQRADAAVTGAGGGASTIYRSVSQTWSEVFPRGQWASQGSDGRVPLHCRAALATAALPALLPPPDAGTWGHTASDARALSPLEEGGAPLHKGLGLLLVCAALEQCAAAVQGLWAHVPEPCADCLLLIQEGELAQGETEARGTLQARLVATLRRCPHALVAVDATAIAAAPDVALPVLINALSERGHFQAGGQQVPSSGAVYIITMAAPAEIVAAAGDEDAFKSAVKAALVAAVSVGAPASGLAEALRRRVDVVAPARGSGPLAVRAAAAGLEPAADDRVLDLGAAGAEAASELHVDYPMQ